MLRQRLFLLSCYQTRQTVLVPVSCAGVGSCSVTLAMSVTETLKGSRIVAIGARVRTKRKVVVVGSVRATVTAGRTVTLGVRLSGTGQRLLKRMRTLPVTLTVTQAGRQVARDRFRLRRR